MKTITATKFKEQCLALLERVRPEGLVITKHGKPIAKLVPVTSDSAELIGALKGKVELHDDAFSTGVRWDAQS